jgi:predicted nucleic acid-binding protein
VEIVEPIALDQPACRDPDDDIILATALAAHADLIISGDDDLLVLHPFQGIPILNASQALEFLANSR